MVLLGASLLWFGWFGFNAGSALLPDGVATVAAINTQVAGAGGLLAWTLVERWRFGRATTLGMASGAVAGLVAITPAAGYVSPSSAVAVGCLAGVLCHLSLGVKMLFRLDDALDVAAVHLVGGLVGALSVGVFASRAVNSAGADGLLFGGGYRLLRVQATASLAVFAYSFLGTLLLALLIKRVLRQRVSQREESQGLDVTQHGEAAYFFDTSVVPDRAPAPAVVTVDSRPGTVSGRAR